jgi:hypothetical protein
LWAEQHVRTADYVLIVCTETYRRRADGEEEPGKGLGGAWEARLIRQLLYNARGMNERFVPALLSIRDSEHIPLMLQGYTYFALDRSDDYDNLLRVLKGEAKITECGGPLG